MSTSLPSFSHIYYERRALEFLMAQRICSRYAHVSQTEIDDYGELFNRKRQNFQIQKQSQALILAVKQDRFLYRGTERVKSFGNDHIYYTDQMRNCVYNCSYCFLQGMHQSAHCVLFVNTHDYHHAVCSELANRPLLNLSVSYLSDLLAVEHLAHLCHDWIQLAQSHPTLKIEIRTKSNNIDLLHDTEPTENVTLVWSLTPRRYAQRYEHGTASLPNRLHAIRLALERGWRVALCFDPIMYEDGWQDEYRTLFAEMFRSLSAAQIQSISYGAFRMHRNYFKQMLNQQPKNDILLQEYTEYNQLTTHSAHIRKEMRNAFEQELSVYYPLERVFFVHG